MSRSLTFVAGLGLLCGTLAGCSRVPEEQREVRPPTVTVSYPLEREVADDHEYTGRTAAVESVDVRAEVTGYLEKINFQDGAEVQQGAVLYQIDPRSYDATLAQAEAHLRLQEANLKYQQATYERDQFLYRTQALSLQDFQQQLEARNTARASVNAAKADAEAARLNVGFTKVRARVGGQVGRTLVTLGNLVVANQTVLTTVVSQNPVYAYFDMDEPTGLLVQQMIREGKFPSEPSKQETRWPVFLGLATETGYPQKGYVDFMNNQFTASTGTLQVRGVFPNPKPPAGPRLLSPGLFVRIRVPVGPTVRALLVTQAAVGTDQNLKFLYVLNDKNEVVRRDVRLGTVHGNLQVIAAGLRANERVIVNGLQHVFPGMTVNPRLVPMPAPGERTGPSRVHHPQRRRAGHPLFPAVAGPAFRPAAANLQLPEATKCATQR